MKSKKIISIILLTMSFVGILKPVIASAVTYEQNDIQDYQSDIQDETQTESDIPSVTKLATEFSSDTQSKMDKVDSLLQNAESNPTQDNVKEIIDCFTSIDLVGQDIQAYEYNRMNNKENQCDTLFERIIEVIKKLPDDIRNKDFVELSKKLSEDYNVTFKNGYNSFFRSYVAELNTLNIPEIKDELNKYWLYVSNRYSDNMQEEADAMDKESGINRDELIQSQIENEVTVDIKENNYSSSVSYVNENGKVYKVTKYIDENGVLVNTLKELAPKEDYVYAGIYDYIDIGGGKSSIPVANVNTSWNYVNQNQNPESNLTVQYCINKDTDNPYYYDTGIRTSLDGKISYEQLRDVLYQVAVKSGGWFTEDTDKLLAIIEGKPLLAKDTKRVYTMEDINMLFVNFKKVDVKILETRIGKTQSLDDDNISTNAKNIKVKDKQIELVTTPLIKESRVLLPIEQIATEMGATVKKQDNKYIITRTLPIWRTVNKVRKIVGHVTDTIVYEMNKNYVIVNGQMIQMGTSPDMKDGNFMAEAQSMAKALGYKTTWDTETGTLTFK